MNVEQLLAPLVAPPDTIVSAVEDLPEDAEPVHVVIFNQSEDAPATNYEDVPSATWGCAAVNACRIEAGMADPLRKRVPLYLMQVEYDEQGKALEATWGGRMYELDEAPELDPTNLAMRAATMLTMSNEIMPETKSQPIKRVMEDGSYIIQTVGQIPIKNGWTLDTVYTTYHAINSPDNPEQYIESWACPAEYPVMSTFYTPSGKGNAAETVAMLDAQTQPMSIMDGQRQ